MALLHAANMGGLCSHPLRFTSGQNARLEKQTLGERFEGTKNRAHGRVFRFLVAGAGFGTLPVMFNLAA